MLDSSHRLRDSTAVPREKLVEYLKNLFVGWDGQLEIEQFPSGHSNLTFLLRISGSEYVLRRPPFGAKIKSAHDMGREYRTLVSLCEVYPKVPRPIAYCEDETIIGAPFYIMERVRGMILRRDPPKGVTLTRAQMRALSEEFIDNLAEIHSLDPTRFGDVSRAQGYVERQVRGWTERYQNSQTDDLPDIEAVAHWLGSHLPPDSSPTLIHNDYKYDNLVLSPDLHILAVLDWEMATVGDPLMDLGTTLGYWVTEADDEILQQMRFCATTLPGNLTRTELIERYQARSGRNTENMLFYYIYGLFKIAVIAQQIYNRYRLGHSRDERFAKLIDGIRVLGTTAVRAIENGRF